MVPPPRERCRIAAVDDIAITLGHVLEDANWPLQKLLAESSRPLPLATPLRIVPDGVSFPSSRRENLRASAATDVALGLLLLVGLSIATLIVTLFGPTTEMVASFAWILAISFVVTGGLLLEIASCERDSAVDG